jgi:hypothetical protein
LLSHSLKSDNNDESGQEGAISVFQPLDRHPDNDRDGDNGVVQGPTVQASVEMGKTVRT